MVDGKNFFDQPVENNKVTNENIATGQGDDYTTDCFKTISALKIIAK